MDVRKMPLEDLELLSYADIAYELLKLDKKSKTTHELFKEVCNLLDINEDSMFDMIGDFYTTLTTDKRFILLDTSEWDLKDSHSVKLVVDEDEEDDDEEKDEEVVVEGTEDEAVTNENDFDDNDSDDIDNLDDLVVVNEEDLEEE